MLLVRLGIALGAVWAALSMTTAAILGYFDIGLGIAAGGFIAFSALGRLLHWVFFDE